MINWSFTVTELLLLLLWVQHYGVTLTGAAIAEFTLQLQTALLL